MPSRQRRLLFLASVLCLALPASASAALVERAAPPAKPLPRIINGTAADQDEYPAQGRLLFDVDPGPVQALASCGGTLVGSRQFLTAAHCAVDSSVTPLPPQNFNVFLGEVDRNLHGDANRNFVVANEVHPDYDAATNQNDVAMLTLSEPVDFEPARVVEPGDEDLWAPGTIARIIGWGRTIPGNPASGSQFLLEANVPIVTDATCLDPDSYGTDFDPETMLCAGDPPGTVTPHDTCQGDSGGPLYVPDFGSTTTNPIFATAGVVSWGFGCADTQFPGVYSRIGEGALNTWTLGNTPLARFTLDHAAVAGEPVTLFSTSTHPEGPSGFTEFNWDFDEDGQFDDAEGESLEVTFPAAGERLIGIEASKPGGDRASFYGVFDVAAPPPPPVDPGTTPPTGGGTPPPTTLPGVTPKLARFIGPKSVRAKGGRFKVKVRFATTAPNGTARLSVLFKGKKIGSGKVKSKPGRTATAKVKLTKAGLKRLKKAGKLKVSLRLTLSGSATVKRSLTLKR